MMATTGARVGLLLADKQPGGDTGGQGPDFGKASPIALLVILLLLVGVVFLVRSMNRHLKRAHANLDESEQAAGTEGGDGQDGSEQAAGTEGDDGQDGSGQDGTAREDTAHQDTAHGDTARDGAADSAEQRGEHASAAGAGDAKGDRLG